jgi:rubrerythrin
MNTQLKTVNSSIPKFELANKPTVIITPKLKAQIDWLHKKVGSREWSGELITSEINTINHLDEWTIVCEDIYLTDIGTAGFTGYEVDKGGFKAADIVDLYETYPELLEGTKKAHHIHTHHNMDAFFSGTDWSQLHDRGVLSNYFLMLIVNFAGKCIAKVAFKAKQKSSNKTSLEFANNTDSFNPLKIDDEDEKEVLVVMDCNVIVQKEAKKKVSDKLKDIAKLFSEKEEVETSYFEEMMKLINTKDEVVVEKSFSERYDKVEKAIEQERKSYTTVYTPGRINFPTTGGKTGSWEEPLFKTEEKKKTKKFMEMTDKELSDYFQNSYGSKFSLPEAFIVCNYVLDPSLKKDLNLTPINKFYQLNNSINSETQLSEFLIKFVVQMKNTFEMVYPNAGISDYLDTLEAFNKYLKSLTSSNRLIKAIIEEIDDVTCSTYSFI